MTNDLNSSLTYDNLDQVTGGMACADGLRMAKCYTALANVFGAVGNPVESSYYSGKASGVLQGSCPK